MARGFVFLAVIGSLAAGNAGAQTIQLPNFSSFSVSTSVLVPDSGPSPLAADRRAQVDAFLPNGLPRNRAVGSGQFAAGADVKASIHDQRAADLALRGKAAAPGTVAGRTAPPVLSTAPRAGDAGLQSVKQLEAARAEKTAQQSRIALLHLDNARRALAANKPAVAAIYYKNAAAEAPASLKSKIEAEAQAKLGK